MKFTEKIIDTEIKINMVYDFHSMKKYKKC